MESLNNNQNNKKLLFEKWSEATSKRKLEIQEKVHLVPCIQMAKTLLRSNANFKEE